MVRPYYERKAMRIGIQIDEQLYPFYAELPITTKLPLEAVKDHILIYDTSTQEWTWSNVLDARELGVNLIYMSPANSQA